MTGDRESPRRQTEGQKQGETNALSEVSVSPTPTPVNRNLTAALAYAEWGRRVFPVHWPLDGRCSCGDEECGNTGKHPVIKGNLQKATTDISVIRQWWQRWPRANIGLVTGNGLLVVDVDPRKGGDESLRDLGELPDTVTSLTGGGGRHLLFAADTDYTSRAGALGPGLDIRSAGAFIVVPPSRHISGGSYTWEVGHALGEIPLAPLPPTIAARLRENERPAQEVAERIPKGQRHDTLVSLAGTMRRRGMTAEEIAAALASVNDGRCDPPLGAREVERIASSVAHYPPAEPETESPSLAETPILAILADIDRQEVEWLWQDRLPRGRLTILEGDPGVGKSWLALAIATAITRGAPLPGQGMASESASVLLLTAEDGLADTVRPRMEDLGADLKRVTVLTAVRDREGKQRHLSLVDDLAALDKALAPGGYDLLIIDPINAYLGFALDTHRDAALRAVLTPLAQLAERWGVATICIRHLTKSGRDRAIYRGQGNIAYAAAARVVHLVGVNPDDPHERAMACIKNNLAAQPPALAFELTDGRFLWRGETSVTAAALLRPDAEEGEGSALTDAQNFLLALLADGPVEAGEVLKQARQAAIAEKTLRRAKATLGVRSQRQEGIAERGYWQWALPNMANSPHYRNLAMLDGPDRDSEGQHENLTTLAGTPAHTLPVPADAPLDEYVIPPEITGKRHYVCALGAQLGFPRVAWDGGGIPEGRFYYEQAARFFTDSDIEKAIGVLERMCANA